MSLSRASHATDRIWDTATQGGGRSGLTLGYYFASPTGTLATVVFSLATCLQGVVTVALFDLGGGLPPTCLSCANAHSE